MLKHEEHEALLTELLNTEIEHSRKTEILQTLRTDYATVRAEQDDLTKSNTKLKTDNDDLVISNSKLFRQLGSQNQDEEGKKKDEQKEFSETVTIEQLEKG